MVAGCFIDGKGIFLNKSVYVMFGSIVKVESEEIRGVHYTFNIS